jgi:hypothetical protein
MATKNHMLLVLEIFNKDQHGLLEEDINVKDKQKISVVQQIVFPKVRACQRYNFTSSTYLGVFGSFLWSVNSIRTLSLFVVHMIYFGIEHIHNVQHGHNLQNNLLTKESIIDC